MRNLSSLWPLLPLSLVAVSLYIAGELYVEDDRQYRSELQKIEVVGMKARQCGMLAEVNPWGDDESRRSAWNRGFYGARMQALPNGPVH